MNKRKKHHTPTDETKQIVTSMAGYGVPISQIAALLKINHETLRTHYKQEMETGRAKASFRIGQSLFQKAISGDTSALMWWTKSQMGWKETKAHEITSPDGSMSPAIQNIAIIDAIKRKHSIEAHTQDEEEENVIEGEYSDNRLSYEESDDTEYDEEKWINEDEEDNDENENNNDDEAFINEVYIDNEIDLVDKNIVRHTNERSLEWHQNKIIEDINSKNASIEKQDLEETYDYDDTISKDISEWVDNDFLNHNFLNINEI